MLRFVLAAACAAMIAAPAMAQQAEQQQPPQLQNLKKTQNGDWTLECGEVPGNNQRICQMTQVINNPKTGKAIMQAVVIKPPGSPSAVMRLIAPLGVWLRPGVGFNVDGGSAETVQFDFCLREGCIAQIAVSTGLANAMKRGSRGQISIQNIRRQKLDLAMSLRGFTASFDSL